MKKIFTVTAGLLICLGCFTSFAASDGAHNMKSWYDRAFGYAADEAGAEYFSGLTKIQEEGSLAREKMKGAAKKEIGFLSSILSRKSNDEMSRYQEHYIKVAEQAEQSLKEKDLADVKNEELRNLEAELEAEAAAILGAALK